MKELKETTRQAYIADKVQRYWELNRLLNDAKKTYEKLRDELKLDVAAEGGEIHVEGLPALRLKSRSTGWSWDSTAIRSLMEKHPKEWERLVELGAVNLHGPTIDAAIKNGQLLGRPFGGMQGSTDVLAFEKERL